MTVEGGGVNATIITANIAATNGLIHIIDRVLGVPYTTVLEKLKTDPMLKWVNIFVIFTILRNFYGIYIIKLFVLLKWMK